MYPSFGSSYVIKATFNREKDLVFVWRTTGLFHKQMQVYELHYLEQLVPHLVSSWKTLGATNKDGIVKVTDMRLNHELLFYNEKKYWNVDERDHFMKNTMTHWNGLRGRNVDDGIFINNNYSLNAEDELIVKETNEELRQAIQKHGPLQSTDYDLNYRYQLRKRVNDMKKEMANKRTTDIGKLGEYTDFKLSNDAYDHGHKAHFIAGAHH
jgi:hypothetical protein